MNRLRRPSFRVPRTPKPCAYLPTPPARLSPEAAPPRCLAGCCACSATRAWTTTAAPRSRAPRAGSTRPSRACASRARPEVSVPSIEARPVAGAGRTPAAPPAGLSPRRSLDRNSRVLSLRASLVVGLTLVAVLVVGLAPSHEPHTPAAFLADALGPEQPTAPLSRRSAGLTAKVTAASLVVEDARRDRIGLRALDASTAGWTRNANGT